MKDFKNQSIIIYSTYLKRQRVCYSVADVSHEYQLSYFG